jgi:periplasmic protein CpxP/Spy
MKRMLGLILISWITVAAWGQSPQGKYQPGTIMDVATHQNAPGEPASGPTRYDVSVKVGDTVYVALFTPVNSSNTVEYAKGFDLLVLVGTDTLTFNSKLSGTTTMPILRREKAAASPAVDLARAPSQYFSMKMQNLTEKLALTDDQQAKVRPIAEAEATQLTDLWGNPALSPKDKANKLEKVVRASDQQLKPILTPDQWTKLQAMRTDQKQKVNQWVADQKAAKKS